MNDTTPPTDQRVAMPIKIAAVLTCAIVLGVLFTPSPQTGPSDEDRARMAEVAAIACDGERKCAADKYETRAWSKCRPLVQAVAKYGADVGFFPDFDAVKFPDLPGGVIEYGGNARLNNAFGAAVASRFWCRYNFRTKTAELVSVEAKP